MKRKIRNSVLLLALLAASSGAQSVTIMHGSDPQPSFGVFADVNMNMARASFTQLPNVPECNSLYQSGFGIEPSLGLFYEIPFSSTVSLQLRGIYDQYGEKLISREQSPILVGGLETPAVIEHSIDATLAMAGLEPIISYALFPAFSLRIGANVGYVIQSSFSQVETLVEPQATGRFENGLRTRNQQSGKIPNANRIAASLIFGASFPVPLNSMNTLQAVPEVFYTFGLTSIIRNVNWMVNAFRGGITFRYTMPESLPAPEPSKPTVIADIHIPPPEPAIILPMPTITATGIDAQGKETPVATIRVEEVYSIRMTPLLPYIFFEHAEQTIPFRYKKIKSDGISDFSETNLKREDALAVNHETLNIIGKRLTEDPYSTITLAGITLHGIIDKKLALSRAEAVAAYLELIWHIPEKRIRLITHMLAQETIAALDSDGIAEANRVEIASNSFNILQPVLGNDTLRTVTPSRIRFHLSAGYSEKVAHWNISASQEGKTLKSYDGKSEIPPSIEWILWDDQSAIPRYPGKLDYSLEVAGSDDRAATGSGSLSVEQLSLKKKRIQRIADREIEKYNLLLFDLQSSELSETDQQIVELIRQNLKDISTITIIGHTDRTGESKSNKRLSLERAKNTAQKLGVTKAEIRGIANEIVLYDNTIPEGRCLSRTVDIIIETPAETQ